MSKAALDILAAKAMLAWGVDAPQLRLISHRENAVFETALPDGQRVAMRLHRPGYNSDTAIHSELWWSFQLADARFSAPTPIKTMNGSLVEDLGGGQIATVISWVDGQQIGSSGAPLAGTLLDQIDLYMRVGEMLAKLHDITDTLVLPADFNRPRWDSDGFLSDNPHWGRFWENPSLNNAQVELLQAARFQAKSDLSRYSANGADFGLIHADALRENVFLSDTGLTLIDFDDSGFGFRLYDLTTALSQSLEDENYQELKAAILEGYAKSRAITPLDEQLFPLFAMLRTFASLGWVIPRLEPGDEKITTYVKRATVAAQRYLKA